MPENTITTIDGLSVRLHPVSPYLLQKVRAAIDREFRAHDERLDPPTYTVETATGDKQTFTHDAKSIETATDEEKAAWTEYLDATSRYAKAMNDRVTRVLVLRGIEWGGQIPEQWKLDMVALGVELPANPDDLAVEYITTEVLKSMQDIEAVMAAILKLSSAGAPEDAIKAAEAMFRHALEGQASGQPANTEG